MAGLSVVHGSVGAVHGIKHPPLHAAQHSLTSPPYFPRQRVHTHTHTLTRVHAGSFMLALAHMPHPLQAQFDKLKASSAKAKEELAKVKAEVCY